jgi:CubicO group peptidase (beta-lactamase class C family)
MTTLMNVRADVDAVITRALSENRIVGTVVLIAREGELVYERAAGFADREAGTAMRVGTLFRLASVTKSIVSAAAMASIERDEGPTPGWGFGFGGSVLLDPPAAGSPQSGGTWQWGGVYGHSWFVDPERRLTVIALTNTALEGLFGRFPIELRDAIYRGL